MSRLRSNASFVRLFVGRIVTNAGDSLYSIAAMWLVYDLTGSAFYTGVASFLTLGPQALQFLAGPLVDRWSLKRVLVWTQAVQAVGVLAVPVAAATGHLTVWLVLLVMPVLSLVSQFDAPAMTATLPRVVEDDQLVRANSLFSAAGKSLDAVFNAASGALIAVVGAVAIYLVDAVTFAVALVMFLGLHIDDATDEGGATAGSESAETPSDSAGQAVADSAEQAVADGGTRDGGSSESDATDGATGAPSDSEAADDPVGDYVRQLREGFAYLRGSAVASMVLGTMVVNFTFGVMLAVLPAFAESLGGPETYGLLMAAVAAGNLVGSVGSSLVDDYPFGGLAVACFAVSAVCMFGAVSLPGVPATAALFFAAFVPAGAFNVVFASMLQSVVEEGMLARVSSVSSSGSAAMMPVGSLLGGVLAGALGVTVALYSGVVSLAFLAGYFLVRPRLRSLPPVAEADAEVLGLG